MELEPVTNIKFQFGETLKKSTAEEEVGNLLITVGLFGAVMEVVSGNPDRLTASIFAFTILYGITLATIFPSLNFKENKR